jgi:enoyl-CoA hydratase/carnithine racemase
VTAVLTREESDGVVVVRWDHGENRCNPESMAEWHALLDELEAREGPLALVATGTGKFFSNGLDLDRFQDEPEAAGATVASLHRLFGRLLVFPAYTVAAINGHAFAAGAMIASAFDLRIMRAERGYWCLPEVDLGLALTEPMHAVVTAHLPRAAAIDAMLTGRRYSGPDAREVGIVHAVAPEFDLLDHAVQAAAVMAPKDRNVIAAHKRQLFGVAAAVCEAGASSGDVQGLTGA